MDSDFWTSRLAAAKRRFNLQHHQHQLQHHHGLQLDDLEEEDEIRPDFPCPFCYEDFDLTSLCSHLEDEHSSESKFAICPICSVKVSRDMLSHITLQHGHLLKLQRRRRLRRVAVPSSQSLSLLGRDLREAHIQVLQRGGGTYRSSTSNSTSNNASNNSISDSLVSSLVLNFPSMEIEEISNSLASTIDEPSSVNCSASQRIWKSSFDPSLSSEEREKRIEQAKIRAVFVQDLFASALSIS